MPTKRKLAAIMFTDIVGYTAKMEENENVAIKLMEEHTSLVKELVDKYSGHILKHMGDEILIEFTSAVSAVRCAISLQSTLAERNKKVDKGEALWVRIGVHLGDVMIRGDDIFGDGVNVASRVRPIAKPGGICITQPVYDSVKNQVDIDCVHLGPQLLKNVKSSVNIYGVVVEALGDEYVMELEAQEDVDISPLLSIFKSAFGNILREIVVVIANTLLLIGACIVAGITIIGIVFIPAFFGGYVESLIQISRGKKTEIAKFFGVGMNQFGTLLGAAILLCLGIGIGYMLFIIPGIYLTVKWLFVPYIIVDKKVGVSNAFKQSSDMVKGRWWEVFTLWLLLKILASVLALTGIGIFINVPFGTLVRAQYYINIKEQTDR